jgi:hypothetical protein
MKKLVVAALAAALVAPAAVEAQKNKPGSQTITLAASKSTVVFRSTSVLTGKLTGGDVGNQQVILEEDGFPFNRFVQISTTRTDAAGNFSFTVKPGVNARYRVETTGRGRVRSAEVPVNVRIKVTRAVSDATPTRNERVKFAGLAAPAHDGALVTLQRRGLDGLWRNITSRRLLDAGTERSRYAMRVRIRRSGTFRLRVTAPDQDHLNGYSRRIRLRVG